MAGQFSGLPKPCKPLALQVKFGVCLRPAGGIWGLSPAGHFFGLSKRCKSLALQVKFGFCPSPRSEIFRVRLSIAGGIRSLSKPYRSNLGRSQSHRPIFGVGLSPTGEIWCLFEPYG